MSTQDDTPPDVLVARVAAKQHGQISARQLRSCGLDTRGIERRVRNGRLHPVYRNVYSVGHPAVTPAGRFMAAVLACGARAVLSHFAAAALHGLLAWEERDPQVTVRGTSGTPSIDGIDVRRARSLAPRDVWVRAGIRVTSPARTVLDLAATLSPRALRSMVRRALAERIVSERELQELLARSAGHRGVGPLRAVMTRQPVPTRSELEDVVLDLMEGAGLDRPQVNVALRLGGRRIVPDFLWPHARLVVEADGAAWHDHRLAREDDAERQALLEAAGYRVCGSRGHRRRATRGRRSPASAQPSRSSLARTDERSSGSGDVTSTVSPPAGCGNASRAACRNCRRSP
jgi:hypothetical protein